MKHVLLVLRLSLVCGGAVLRYAREVDEHEEETVHSLGHASLVSPVEIPTHFVFDDSNSDIHDVDVDEQIGSDPSEDSERRTTESGESSESVEEPESEEESSLKDSDESNCNATDDEDWKEFGDQAFLFVARDISKSNPSNENTTDQNGAAVEDLSEDEVQVTEVNETEAILIENERNGTLFDDGATNLNSTEEEQELKEVRIGNEGAAVKDATADTATKGDEQEDSSEQESSEGSQDSEDSDSEEEFDRMDSDHNALISFGEFLARDSAYLRETLGKFNTADLNGDAVLSKDEFDAYKEKLNEVVSERENNTSVPLFQEFDDDGDGKLSKEELALMLTTVPFYEAVRVAHAMIQRFDTDNDGTIDEKEFAALQEKESKR